MTILRIFVAAALLATSACGRVAFDPFEPIEPIDALVVPACGSEPSLVACYPLDGDGTDASGLGNHATGPAIFGQGRVGGAAMFDDTTNLRAADSPSLDFAEQLTVMAWVRLDAPPPGNDRGVIVDRNIGFALAVRDAGELVLGMSVEGTPGTWAATPTPIPVGIWTHVAATYDGATASLYIDGALGDARPRTGRIDNADTLGTRIGGDIADDGAPGDEPFLGAIDDLGIWSEALPASRIACAARGDC